MTLRPAVAADAEFLYRVFASTREHELALAGLPAAQIEALLRMQFAAQTHQYRAAYPGAEDSVILVDGAPAGRLRVFRDGEEILLLDIALLPEHRGRGIGRAAIQELQVEASAFGVPVCLHVARTNAATALYRSLGFQVEGGDDVYQAMTWTPAPVTVAGAAG
ncbi:MAG: GNAT family N-acetyltransferase [Chloroflexi bacterium]|nr:MAG: GNAT family N-acetyltransferase [Chloroflexota bacterium]